MFYFARLIGFREHIFTVAHGICGDINAVAEWCFGTSIQRVQTWLGVRMHYGHPDFVAPRCFRLFRSYRWLFRRL